MPKFNVSICALWKKIKNWVETCCYFIGLKDGALDINLFHCFLFLLYVSKRFPFFYNFPRLGNNVCEFFFLFNLLPVSCVDGFAGFNINFNTRRYLAHHSLYSVLSTVPSTYTSTNDRKGKLVHPLNTRAFTTSVAVYRVQTIFPIISKWTLYYDDVVLKLGNSAHVPDWCKCYIV